MTRGPVEQPADWDMHWRATKMDPGVLAAEARTPRWQAQERLVREHFRSFEGLEVIEIGSGRGLNGLLYGTRGARATLVDESELPLEQAKEIWGAHGVEPAVVKGDVFSLPPQLHGRFDIAMSFGLCEHFLGERRREIIRAHLDLLKPGGIAMIGVPNANAPVYRAWKAVLTRRGTWPFGTEVPFTAAELSRLARECGGRPLPAAYGSFVGSIVNHGVNQVLSKLGRTALPVPQVRVPGLDRLAYELLVPIVRP